jgi:DNA-binding FrmR family transcriptional regulator
MGRQRYPRVPKDLKDHKTNIMKNKQLYIRRMERMEGALRAIEGLLGQRDTTIQDIKTRLQVLNDELMELKAMAERE